MTDKQAKLAYHFVGKTLRDGRPRKNRLRGSGGYGAGGYLFIQKNRLRRGAHVWIAERALGHALPPAAVVHHVDENRVNNNPSNLVICPDEAYHHLLHQRMRSLAACGNPNWRKCNYCKVFDDPSRMVITNCGTHHQECKNANAREYRRRQKIAATRPA